MIKSAIRGITPPVLWKVMGKIGKEVNKRVSKWEHGVEQPAEYYDWTFEQNEHWTTHYTASHWYPLWTVVADRIQRADAQKVLDIGCGPGQVAALLSDKDIPEYLGLDFSPSRIKQASQACPGYRFEVADVFETDLLEAWDYDCVLIMEFLEHIERDIDVIKRLKPGVRVIATVPDFPAAGHVRHFTSLESVVERYRDLFDPFDVEPHLINSEGRTHYLIEGIVKGA